MDYFAAVDESDFLFGDDYDEDDHDTDLPTLSSLQSDVPVIDNYEEAKSNCLIEVSNEDNHLILLSDFQNAVISGNTAFIKSLVKKNSDYCNVIFNSGWTPLTYASNFGHVDTVCILLDSGADLNLCGSDGCTAMMAACKCKTDKDALQMLKMILEKGADALLFDKNQKTLLIHAVRSGKISVVELVLNYSHTVINKTDSKGWTALDWAISKSFESIVLCLLRNGATIYCVEEEYLACLSDSTKQSLFSLNKTTDIPNDGTPVKIITNGNIVSNLEDKKDFVDAAPIMQDLINLNIGQSGDGYQKYGQLELLLCGLSLSHLIQKFHDHAVTFDQLLYASNDDLIAIGIRQVGVRNKILTAIKDWHTTDWQESSIPDFCSTALTFGNLQAILRTSSEHLLYISSTLRFSKQQLKSYPQVLKPPASMQLDKNPDEIVIRQVEDLVQSTHKLCRALKTLHNEAIEIKSKSADQYKQVDCITQQNAVVGKKSLLSRRKVILVSLPILACFVYITAKRKFGSFN